MTSPSVDIITCSAKLCISPKDYSIAVNKNIYFEVSYGPMLINSTARQDNFTLAHLLHIKGKSKVTTVIYHIISHVIFMIFIVFEIYCRM